MLTQEQVAEKLDALGNLGDTLNDGCLRRDAMNSLLAYYAALREALARVTAEHVRYREREPQWQEEVRVAKQQLAQSQARIATLEAALENVVEGEYDDLDPDDGLFRNSVRAMAKAALKP